MGDWFSRGLVPMIAGPGRFMPIASRGEETGAAAAVAWEKNREASAWIRYSVITQHREHGGGQSVSLTVAWRLRERRCLTRR